MNVCLFILCGKIQNLTWKLLLPPRVHLNSLIFITIQTNYSTILFLNHFWNLFFLYFLKIHQQIWSFYYLEIAMWGIVAIVHVFRNFNWQPFPISFIFQVRIKNFICDNLLRDRHVINSQFIQLWDIVTSLLLPTILKSNRENK